MLLMRGNMTQDHVVNMTIIKTNWPDCEEPKLFVNVFNQQEAA
jgi:hypothetical protein